MKTDLSVSVRSWAGGDLERVRPGTMWIRSASGRSGSCEKTWSVVVSGCARLACFMSFKTTMTAQAASVRQGKAGQCRSREMQTTAQKQIFGTCSCARLQGTAGRHRKAFDVFRCYKDDDPEAASLDATTVRWPEPGQKRHTCHSSILPVVVETVRLSSSNALFSSGI